MAQNGKKKGRFKFARAKYLIAAAALLFVMLPGMLVKSTQVSARAFISAVGVDRTADGGYEVAAQLILPHGSQGSSDNGEDQSIVTAKGRTLKTAVDGISTKTGKAASLAHCKLLFLGKSVTEEGLIGSLDFFMRSSEVDNGLMIAASSEAAKDNLEKLAEFEKASAFSLPDFFSQNCSNDLNAVVTLKTFMEDYHEGKGDLFLPVIDIRGAELSDEFKTAVIKDGRHVNILDKERTKALLWLNNKVSLGTLPLEHAGDLGKTTLGVKDKHVRLKTSFKDGKPVCKISLSLKLSLDEIEGESGAGLTFEEEKKIGETVAAAVREKISGEILELHRQCAEGDFDVMRINEKFYRFHNKKYKAYLAAGGNIIKDCKVEVKVKADVKI